MFYVRIRLRNPKAGAELRVRVLEGDAGRRPTLVTDAWNKRPDVTELWPFHFSSVCESNVSCDTRLRKLTAVTLWGGNAEFLVLFQLSAVAMESTWQHKATVLTCKSKYWRNILNWRTNSLSQPRTRSDSLPSFTSHFPPTVRRPGASYMPSKADGNTSVSCLSFRVMEKFTASQIVTDPWFGPLPPVFQTEAIINTCHFFWERRIWIKS